MKYMGIDLHKKIIVIYVVNSKREVQLRKNFILSMQSGSKNSLRAKNRLQQRLRLLPPMDGDGDSWKETFG